MSILKQFQDALDLVYKEIDANYTLHHTAGIASRFWYVPCVSCVLYLILVYLGTRWMSAKKPYTLRPLLIPWNLALTAVSVMGAYVMVPDLYQYLTGRGFVASVCTTAIHDYPVLSFWSLIFVFSKVVEFGDTFFIVIRKTPLMFLHWYHHVTVCVFGWYSLAIMSSPAHWYCAMNYSVHSLMYSYYLLKSCKISVPTIVASAITFLQIAQFLMGFAVTATAAQQFWTGQQCDVDNVLLALGLSIYGSYFILFSKFFYDRYLRKRPSTKKKEQ